jgi:hypothetical protein
VSLLDVIATEVIKAFVRPFIKGLMAPHLSIQRQKVEAPKKENGQN